jgi:hypothetical protein
LIKHSAGRLKTIAIDGKTAAPGQNGQLPAKKDSFCYKHASVFCLRDRPGKRPASGEKQTGLFCIPAGLHYICSGKI